MLRASSNFLRTAVPKRTISIAGSMICRYISNTSKQSSTAASAAIQPNTAPSFTHLDITKAKPVPLTKVTEASMDSSLIGLSGGQIFHEMLVRQNVDTVFGYSGGAILPVFDGIYNSPNFKFIMPRHEQGAGHMAEGYAKATGKTGVVVVTSGPGATNVITPLQDALSDGVPMVVFTGQVATTAIGTDAFQEADVVGISRFCTKWNVMVKNIAELPKRINEAFEVAVSGRPGPVLVDLPKDVTSAIMREAIPTASSIPSQSLKHITAAAVSQSQNEAIQQAAELINKAKKPILYVGNGILASEEGSVFLRQLAEKAQIPVTTTLHALGAFDETDPKSLHMLGMHGSGYANMAMQNADLIVALGARFDERITGNLAKFAPAARLAAFENRGGIVHFEIVAKNINKVIESTQAVEGDVSTNLGKLLPLIKPVKDRPEWLGLIADWKKKYPFDYHRDIPNSGEPVKPQTVVAKLSELTEHMKDRVIITTGVGQHQMWTAQFFKFKYPRSMISSGGLGTMGFGLPAAIGAKVGCPDSIVIDIDGDASFNMTLEELSSAVQFNVGIKIIILNNEEQGMVTQWQSLFYNDRFSHTHQKNPDFMKLADAMGLKGIRIKNLEELEPGLQEMLDYNDGPVLVEVLVDQKVPVLPMIPVGKGLDEFIVYNDEGESERKKVRQERARCQKKEAADKIKAQK